MTSFFLDVNVWLAASIEQHVHAEASWRWLNSVQPQDRLIFARYTQLGLLRLLTNQAAMGDRTMSITKAWDMYDRLLRDERVEFHPEPRGLESAFREATLGLHTKAASQWIGDGFLLAFAQASGATLVTFDRALLAQARKQHCSAITPS
jgi:toxin-antitoxin system PIN domain toxin